MSEFITVVIRDAKEPVRLGKPLLSGVVAAATTGNLVEEMFRIEASAVPAAPAAGGTTSDKYRAELYDEVWQRARYMGYGNVTDALVELERLKVAAPVVQAEQRPGAAGLQWSEPKGPDGGKTSYYDHTQAETPLGTAMIEWKSWKDYPGYTVTVGGDWVAECDSPSLDDAKQKVLDHLLEKATAISRIAGAASAQVETDKAQDDLAYSLGNAARRAWLEHGNDSWVTIGRAIVEELATQQPVADEHGEQQPVAAGTQKRLA